jgi:hypothetical protein
MPDVDKRTLPRHAVAGFGYRLRGVCLRSRRAKDGEWDVRRWRGTSAATLHHSRRRRVAGPTAAISRTDCRELHDSLP